MVTKVYCDHCGHAASNAQKYIFGAHSYFFGIKDPGHTNGIGTLAGAQAQQVAQIQNQNNAYQPRPSGIIRVGDVDLCDTCQVVWMKRVKALTQASEP